MQLESFGDNDSGLNRKNIEDAYYINNDLKLFLICDGMGGHEGGEIASKLAIDTVSSHWEKNVTKLEKVDEGAKIGFCKGLAVDALQLACKVIYDKSKEKNIWVGMGASIVLLAFYEGKGICATVGDCRLYLVRSDAAFQLTLDHTMEQEMIQSGLVDKENSGKTKFAKILTRSLGAQESVLVDVTDFDVLTDDQLLLCSNGIHQYFKTDSDILTPLKTDDMKTVCSRFLFNANQRGGSDDMSIVVVKVENSKSKKESLDFVKRKLEALSSISFWNNISFRRLNILESFFELKAFSKTNKEVVMEDVFNSLALVVSGKVLVIDGEEKKTYNAGDYWGERNLIMLKKKKVVIEFLEETELLYLSNRAFQELCRKYPKSGMYLLRKLSRKLV